MNDVKLDILEKYLSIIKSKKSFPVYTDFLPEISKDKIKHHYGNINKLHDIMIENYQSDIEDIILSEHNIFSKIDKKELSNELKNFKKFIVTTVVIGKEVCKKTYENLKNYEKKYNTKLLFLLCEDRASRNVNKKFSTIDPILKNETFIVEDTSLNKNLFLSSIKLSAKHIKPTTGLARIGQRNGSYIFASPKQFLEFVINTPDVDEAPSAIMTTGAITLPNYQTDRYMSERTSYIAEVDHVMGGLIVEIKSSKKFEFRQLQFEKDGSFVDLGIKYLNDSEEKVNTSVVLGDFHAGHHDQNILKKTHELLKNIKIENIVLHDFFDGNSISRYDDEKPLDKVKKYKSNTHDLEKEIVIGAEILNDFAKKYPESKIVYVMGNHDERLADYLARGKYVNDPQNHYYSLDLAKKYLEGQNVIKYAYTQKISSEIENIVWLERDDSFKFAHIELGQHGDKGLNGSRGSLEGAEKSYGNCVIGHSHSGAIMRGVYRVGTSTKLKLDYNKGPSSWTNTHCLVYSNGSRQLINFF